MHFLLFFNEEVYLSLVVQELLLVIKVIGMLIHGLVKHSSSTREHVRLAERIGSRCLPRLLIRRRCLLVVKLMRELRLLLMMCSLISEGSSKLLWSIHQSLR